MNEQIQGLFLWEQVFFNSLQTKQESSVINRGPFVNGSYSWGRLFLSMSSFII